MQISKNNSSSNCIQDNGGFLIWKWKDQELENKNNFKIDSKIIDKKEQIELLTNRLKSKGSNKKK